MRRAQAGPQSGRSEEQRDEAGFQQHAVRLVAGEILRRGDKGQKTHQANPERPAWPQIENHSHRGKQAEPCDQHQRMVAGAKPEKRWRKPETLQARIVICHVAQVTGCRKNAVRADEAFDLKNQRVERRKINKAERAQKKPARQQVAPRAFARRFRPEQPFGGV